MTTPGDLFAKLWGHVWTDLLAQYVAEFPKHPREAMPYPIRYELDTAGDGARIRWAENPPVQVISIFRGRVPPLPTEPDLVTNPERDACMLAHEYGHFLTTKERRERGEPEPHEHHAGDPIPENLAHRREAFDEEEAAWRKAQETLLALGCDEWEGFERQRDKALAGYRKGFFGGDG